MESEKTDLELSSNHYGLFVGAGITILFFLTFLFFTVGAPSLGNGATSDSSRSSSAKKTDHDTQILEEVSLSAFSPDLSGEQKKLENSGSPNSFGTSTDSKADSIEKEIVQTKETSAANHAAGSTTTNVTETTLDTTDPNSVEKIIDGITYRIDAQIIREAESIRFKVEVEDCQGLNLEVFVRTGTDFESLEITDCTNPLTATKNGLDPNSSYLVKVNLGGEQIYYLYISKLNIN